MRHAPRRAWIFISASVAAAVVVGGVSRGSIPEPSNQTWAARYNGPGNFNDAVRSLAVSPDGSKVFVAGESWGSGSGFDYATIAYDGSNGSQLWAARYDGPAGYLDFAKSLAVSPDGSRVFVTGGSSGVLNQANNQYDYATIAYDAASGSQVWAARYDGPGNSADHAQSLAVSPDGSRVFVTGGSGLIGSDNPTDYATIAYDAASGTQLWVARYDGPAGDGEFAKSLAVSPDGSKVFVTGSSGGTDHTYGYATIAYDAATGSGRWVTRFDGPGELATALAVSPDGSKVFVTGESWDSGSYFDYATLAYDTSTGSELWAAQYNGPANSNDAARSLSVSPDGSKVFVTGESWGFDGVKYGDFITYDYATIAYDTSGGSQLWAARYNGNAHDFAYSLAVSPDGSKVFVTGYSYGSSRSYDYATLAYDTSRGSQLWAARYNGNAHDFAYSLAVSPDGSKVFVAGESQGFDFATVAYRTTGCAGGWDETGPVSGPVQRTLLPHGPTPSYVSYVHGANCDIFAGNGL